MCTSNNLAAWIKFDQRRCVVGVATRQMSREKLDWEIREEFRRISESLSQSFSAEGTRQPRGQRTTTLKVVRRGKMIDSALISLNKKKNLPGRCEALLES